MPEGGEGELVSFQEDLLAFKERVIGSSSLDNWVNERRLPQEKLGGLRLDKRLKAEWRIRAERRARKQLADAIKTDVATLEKKGKTTNWLNKAEVERITADVMEDLKPIFADGKITKIRTERDDSVTGEAITAEVGIESGVGGTQVYVARENRKADRSLISEARLVQPSSLNPFGATTLSLEYTGEHYTGANPAIDRDSRLPRATATAFTMIANSVLKNDWVSDIHLRPAHGKPYNVDKGLTPRDITGKQ